MIRYYSNTNVKDFSKDEYIAMARYIVKHSDGDNITYYLENILYHYFAHDDHGIKCDGCGKTFRPDEVIEMLDNNGNILHRCHACNTRTAGFFKCSICGKYHILRNRYDILTLTPYINKNDADKYNITNKDGAIIPFEKLDILKDFNFSDEAISTIKKYYGMNVCPACAKKHDVKDTTNNGVVVDGSVYMKNEVLHSNMSDAERKEVYMSPYSRIFKKYIIEDFAKTKYSNPKIRTKSILLNIINENEDD